MRRLLATLPVLTLLLVAGCSTTETGTETDTKTDTEPDTVALDPAATAAPPAPTVPPTVGTYPAYAPQDYAFTLQTSCFCRSSVNAPVRVTVEAGRVVSTLHATSVDGGPAAGEPAESARALTIQDVVDAANDIGAARVDVDWPAGQDHPTSVYVDADEQLVDEEVGYTISAVVTAPS